MKRILVVDDDHQMRTMTVKYLEKAGFEVVQAENGFQGVEAFERNPVDLVVTDLIMPDKDGLEMIIEIKRQSPELKIVAVSGGSRAVDPKDYLLYAAQAGVNKTLTKPFEPEELIDTINSLLEVTVN